MISEYSGGYSKDGSSVEAIQKPRLTRSDARHNKEELEKEQTVLNNLLEEDDIDDEDSKTSSDDIAPIKISRKFLQLFIILRNFILINLL